MNSLLAHSSIDSKSLPLTSPDGTDQYPPKYFALDTRFVNKNSPDGTMTNRPAAGVFVIFDNSSGDISFILYNRILLV